ncbi:MAG: hypothetical protein ACP5OG_01310 [Candidatus Nanoarchaeia archaeon]
MVTKAKTLREKASRLRIELEQAQNELKTLERHCPHKYTKTVYEPIITPAYTIPADEPGTMGVDRRGPCYVPRKVEDRWKRECEICGLVEYTTRIEQEILKKPKW